MREVCDPDQFQPLGPKVEKPAAEQKAEWKPTDRPGIERNCEDGKLRNVSPTPSDRASFALSSLAGDTAGNPALRANN